MQFSLNESDDSFAAGGLRWGWLPTLLSNIHICSGAVSTVFWFCFFQYSVILVSRLLDAQYLAF